MRSFFLATLLAPAAHQAAAFVPSHASQNAIHQSETAISMSSSDTTRRTMLTNSLATLTTLSTPLIASAFETYLTEPTDEFKESEKQRMEFRKAQLELKGEFVKVLARLTTDSKTEEELVNDLKELRALVVRTGGLPQGIKKEDMYKIVRGKKAKGFWPTDVEIA